MDESVTPRNSLFALHRIPNGIVTLLAVALILQGPAGAFETFWKHTSQMSASLLGGENIFVQVLYQTAPLAVSAAFLTLVFRSGWFNPHEIISIVAAGTILLGATWFGTEIRSFRARSLANDPGSHAMLVSRQISGEHDNAPSEDLTKPNLTTEPREQAVVSLSIGEGIQMLTGSGASDTNSIRHRWSDPIPRVLVFPHETNSTVGLIANSANQLCGYFAVYGLRLFASSLLLGCYIGWTLQPYLQAITSIRSQRPHLPLPADQ
jgi:hypothetical protein|tara:strand:+ start:639 stop:1430 length:792 start_codon:yes stop_codon:yes gene_type:complete